MDETLEDKLSKVFRHYEGMLRTVFPDSTSHGDERTQYEEYFANMLDNIETEEELRDFLRKMVER